MRVSASLLPITIVAAVWSLPATAQPTGAPPAPAATATAVPAPSATATAPGTATAPSPEPAAQAPPPAPQPAPPAAQPPGPLSPSAPARSADRWWDSYEPRERSGAKLPMIITGSALAGLGAMTLLAAGVTWLTAWGNSSRLECDEHDAPDFESCCPAGNCVKGTRGGDAYESTRDLSTASQVLVAIAFPMMGAGVSLAILGAGVRGGGDRRTATIKATPSGVVLEGTF